MSTENQTTTEPMPNETCFGGASIPIRHYCPWPGCKTSCGRKYELKRHFQAQHSKSQSNEWYCPFRGCKYSEEPDRDDYDLIWNRAGVPPTEKVCNTASCRRYVVHGYNRKDKFRKHVQQCELGKNVEASSTEILEVEGPRGPILIDVLIHGVSDENRGFRRTEVSRIQRRDGTWTEWEGPDLDAIQELGCQLWDRNFETRWFVHEASPVHCPKDCKSVFSFSDPPIHEGILGRKREPNGTWSSWKGATAQAAALCGFQTTVCFRRNIDELHGHFPTDYCQCDYLLRDKIEDGKNNTTNGEGKSSPRTFSSITSIKETLPLPEVVSPSTSQTDSNSIPYSGPHAQPSNPSDLPALQASTESPYDIEPFNRNGFLTGPPAWANSPYIGHQDINGLHGVTNSYTSPYAPQLQTGPTFYHTDILASGSVLLPGQYMPNTYASTSQNTDWPTLTTDQATLTEALNETEFPPQAGF